jgi:AcrR family transcriptional regulator
VTETDKRILDAATDLLLSSGSDAVTMRRVAAVVGVTPMALYRYFPGREALLRRLADDQFQAVARRWGREPLPGDPTESGHAIVDLFVDLALDNPGLFAFLFIEKRPGARRFPGDFADDASPTFALMRGFIAKSVEEGVIRPMEPWQLALTVTALIHGMTQLYVNQRVDVSPEEFRRLCHQSMELLLNGILEK